MTPNCQSVAKQHTKVQCAQLLCNVWTATTAKIIISTRSLFYKSSAHLQQCCNSAWHAKDEASQKVMWQPLPGCSDGRLQFGNIPRRIVTLGCCVSGNPKHVLWDSCREIMKATAVFANSCAPRAAAPLPPNAVAHCHLAECSSQSCQMPL